MWALSSWLTRRCSALALPLLAACEANSLKPPPTPADQLYWDIALNHRAVMLSTTAPYDTLTLAVTPRNARGEPLAGAPAPRYLSRDVDHVVVTADGVLHAVAAGSEPVWVVATLTWNDVTYRDSVLVKVADEPAPPVLASFSIHPIPPDSAKVAVRHFVSPVLPVQAADTSGRPLTGLAVAFHASDTNIATVDLTKGFVTGQLPGVVMIDASTTMYGVTKVDTLAYRIGWPVVTRIGIWQHPSPDGSKPPGLYPSEVTVGTGALIIWSVNDPRQHEALDIFFAEGVAPNVTAASTTTIVSPLILNYYCSAFQTDCNATGSFVIPAGTGWAGALRVLSVPGVYDYHSTNLGMSGRIVVVDER